MGGVLRVLDLHLDFQKANQSVLSHGRIGEKNIVSSFGNFTQINAGLSHLEVWIGCS